MDMRNNNSLSLKAHKQDFIIPRYRYGTFLMFVGGISGIAGLLLLPPLCSILWGQHMFNQLNISDSLFYRRFPYAHIYNRAVEKGILNCGCHCPHYARAKRSVCARRLRFS